MCDNPSQRAAAAPETKNDETPVFAIGVGPGNPEFLTERALTRLATADVIVGFESVVDVVRDRTEASVLACGYDDQSETLATFANRVQDNETGVAVLMGDPNVSGYQFLGRIEGAVEQPIRVIPGISSVQVAASRARTPLEQSTIVSLHRRGSLEGTFERIESAAFNTHIICLPRPYDWMPSDIAARLLAADIDADRPALVFDRLTFSDESVTRTTVADLASADGLDISDLSILVVRAPEPTPVTRGGENDVS